MTMVGSGDIAPQTILGKGAAAFVMILGYAIVAVPTGIVSAEPVQAAKLQRSRTTRACPGSGVDGHDADAVYCRQNADKL